MATRTISNAGGNWNTTGAWVEGVVPTSADDVVATATSGNLTLTSGAACRSINLTNYVATLTHPTSVVLLIGDGTPGAGNVALKFVAGMTYTLGNPVNSAISFVQGHTTQQTIDFGGKTHAALTFAGASSTTPSWLLTGPSTQSNVGAGITHQRGHINTNGQTCTWGVYGSPTAFSNSTRTLTLGASTINIFGSGTGMWNIAGVGYTLNAGTSTIICNSSGDQTFNGAGLTYYTVRFTGFGGAVTLNGANTFTNLERSNVGAPTDGQLGTLTLTANQTVTGTFTATGQARNRRVIIQGNGWYSVQRTITAAGVSLTNADFLSVVGTGAANWTGTSIGNCLNNSGITFTAAKTAYRVGGTGNWSDGTKWAATSGGAGGIANFPLPQDTARFDANTFTAGGQSITADYWCICSQNWTGSTNNPNFIHFYNFVYQFGDALFISAMTFTNGIVWITTGGTITTAGGNTGIGPWPVVGPGLSVVMADNGGLDHLNTLGTGFDHSTAVSTFNFNGKTISMKTCVLSAGSKIHMTNCTLTLIGSGSGTWEPNSVIPTGLNTSTINITDASVNAKNFQGRGLSYGTLSIAAGGAGPVNIWFSNSFVNIHIAGPKTVLFESNRTQTISGIFTATGTAGNLVTMHPVTSGTRYTLSKASGVISVTYASIKDSNVTGGASWYAGLSTDGGNNVGWNWTAAPAPTVNITGQQRTKISRVSGGPDSTTVSFTVSEVYSAYKVKIAASGATESQGTLIESGSGGNASEERTVTLTDDEMVAAGATEGDNSVKIFAQSTASGLWST